MSGGDKTTTTSSSSAPWGPSQGYLKQTMKEAGGLFNSGVGFNPNTTSMVTPFAQQTTQGMDGIMKNASSFAGSAASKAPMATAMETINNGGMNKQLQAASNNATNRMNGSGLDGLQNLAMNDAKERLANGGFNNYQQNAMDAWQGTANGGDMEGNPYFEDVLKQATDDAQNAVNLQTMGMGRYGSGAHQGVLAQEVGDLSSRMRYQNFTDQQGRMDAARSNLFSGGQQGTQNRVQASSELMAGGQTAYGNRAGAAQELAGYGQQAMANQTNAANSIPGLYQAQQAPYQDMMGVGAMNEDLYTRNLNDQARIFDETQQKPWERVGMANAIFSGAGQLGGTSTGTATQPGRGMFGTLVGAGATLAGLPGGGLLG